MPVHMACLSGYSDCVENIIPRGILVCVHACEKGKVPILLFSLSLLFLTSLLLLSLPPLPGHRLASEVDDEDRTCLHAAACGG